MEVILGAVGWGGELREAIFFKFDRYMCLFIMVEWISLQIVFVYLRNNFY